MSDGQAPATEVEDREDLIISLLSDKAVSLGTEVTGLLPQMDNVLGVLGAILIGAVTLGATDKHPIIFVLLPFPLIVLFVYLLQSNTEMLSRAGHKRFLEEKINELITRPIMLEEAHVAKTLHGSTRFGRWSIVMIQSMMIVLLLGSSGVAVANLGALGSLGWEIVFWLGLLAGLTNLGLAAAELSASYDAAYEAAKLGYDGAPAPEDPLVTPPRPLRAVVRQALARARRVDPTKQPRDP